MGNQNVNGIKNMTTLKTFTICAQTMILRQDKILLIKRAGSLPLWPGYWQCPAGKMEGDESPRACSIREIFEEIGLKINPTLGTVVAVNTKRLDRPSQAYRDINFFFVATEFDGEPVNQEPHLHDAMDWFDLNNLPDSMIPSVKFGIEQYRRGESYGEFGYEKSECCG